MWPFKKKSKERQEDQLVQPLSVRVTGFDIKAVIFLVALAALTAFVLGPFSLLVVPPTIYLWDRFLPSEIDVTTEYNVNEGGKEQKTILTDRYVTLWSFLKGRFSKNIKAYQSRKQFSQGIMIYVQMKRAHFKLPLVVEHFKKLGIEPRGDHESWLNASSVLSKEKFTTSHKGIKHAITIHYSANNTPVKLESYRKDVLHGEQITFDMSGKASSCINYNEGVVV